MDSYLLALFAHFVALAGAVVMSTLMHFNVIRARHATTVRDARDAVSMVSRSAPFMSLFGLALLASGATLVRLRFPWSSSWVIAGIVGLVSMTVTGLTIAKPRLEALLTQFGDGDGPLDPAMAAAIRSPVIMAVLNNNHVMALAVMLIMVTKPAPMACVAILLVAPAVGVATVLAPARSGANRGA